MWPFCDGDFESMMISRAVSHEEVKRSVGGLCMGGESSGGGAATITPVYDQKVNGVCLPRKPPTPFISSGVVFQ
jgi:hypothetical protein